MTVIAWDDLTLAADKMADAGGSRRTVTKIYRLKDGSLVGCSGGLTKGMQLIDWLDNSRDPDKYPDNDDGSGNSIANLLHITVDGRKFRYEAHATPFEIEDEKCAVGSGIDFAIMAMHLGHSASDAVNYTNELCTSCGCGVDTLRLIKETL